MKPIFLLLVVTVAIGLLAAPAASQPANDTNATATPTATPTATSTPTPTPTATATSTPTASRPTGEFDQENATAGDRATIHVDSDVRIEEWEYSDNAFHIRFEVDSPTFVTLQGSTQQEEGASTFSIAKERLLPGTNDVMIPVEPVGGEAAVAITTSESIENGEGTKLSTGVTNDSLPFENTSSTAGWIGGAGTMAFLFVVVGWRAKRKQPDAPRSAE